MAAALRLITVCFTLESDLFPLMEHLQSTAWEEQYTKTMTGPTATEFNKFYDTRMINDHMG